MHLVLKISTLRHQICTYLHSWQAPRAKKCRLDAFWYHFKDCKKSPYLYFC